MKFITFILTFPELSNTWSKGEICLHHNFVMNDFLNNPTLFSGLNYYHIMQNPNITVQDILKYHDKKNRTTDLERNRDLKSRLLSLEPYVWCAVCFNSDIDLSFINSNLDLFRGETQLSRNLNITLDYVAKHLDWDWNWTALSLNPNITLEDLLNHPELETLWQHFGANPNVNLEDILAHPEIHWYWDEISINPNITLEDLLNHPELIEKWDWCELSRHRNITLNDILSHPELPWEWNFIMDNPNITRSEAKSHPGLKWNWDIYYDSIIPLRDNYVKIKLLNLLDNPQSKLCATLFEM